VAVERPPQVRRAHRSTEPGEERGGRVGREVPVLEEREDAEVVGDRGEEQRVSRHGPLRPLERPGAVLGMAIYWAAEIACLGFALRCFEVEISIPALVVAYATGYAASRRSLPLGGAGITEALLTVSLIAVHVPAAHALFAVIAYRLINFLAPMLPGLLAHSSLESLLDAQASEDVERAGRLDQRLVGASRPAEP